MRRDDERLLLTPKDYRLRAARNARRCAPRRARALAAIFVDEAGKWRRLARGSRGKPWDNGVTDRSCVRASRAALADAAKMRSLSHAVLP